LRREAKRRSGADDPILDLADRLLAVCIEQTNPGNALGALLVAAGVVSLEQRPGHPAIDWDEAEARKHMGMMFNLGRDIGKRMREVPS
jgi:hypothetical protein